MHGDHFCLNCASLRIQLAAQKLRTVRLWGILRGLVKRIGEVCGG